MDHPIHPMVVHFPIALLSTAVALDLVGMYFNKPQLRRTGTLLLILGWLGGLMAALTGILGEEAAEEMGVPEEAIETHESLAIALVIVFAALVVLRWWRGERWEGGWAAVYWVAVLAGLVLIAIVGYTGGELVYRFGAGVRTGG